MEPFEVNAKSQGFDLSNVCFLDDVDDDDNDSKNWKRWIR